TLVVTLDCGCELALSLGGRLLVVLAGTQLGEQAGLLHGALEAAHRHFERLVFFHAYGRHRDSSDSEKGRNCIRIIRVLFLGIETSSDETGVALSDRDARRLLAQALHSQVAMHEAYGGVVPELASRDHNRRLVPLTRQVLEISKKEIKDLGAIGYTEGP